MDTEKHTYRRADAGADRDLDVLMAAVALGDPDAFADLYAVLFPLVRAGAVRVLWDRAQAEEVAQEVIAQVWGAPGRFRPERGSVIGWVLLMAHRRAVDRLRHHQAALRRDLLVAAREDRSTHDMVPEQVERRLEYQEVRRCVGALTPYQRQALDLAYYQGRTHAQAADLLGIPLGTFKSRVHQALLQLRRDLE